MLEMGINHVTRNNVHIFTKNISSYVVKPAFSRCQYYDDIYVFLTIYTISFN